jgi:hypothetical protein
MKYIGIPLAVTKLPKATLPPLVYKVTNRLPNWKGKLMHRCGRLTLIKTMLSAMPVYKSIGLALPAWANKALEKIMKTTLLTRTNEVRAGKCLVTWGRVQKTLQVGGLSIPDSKQTSIALRT